VRNSLYEEDARELFNNCGAVALHWDSSNYHGLIVNVASAVHTRVGVGAHVRPMVLRTNALAGEPSCGIIFTSQAPIRLDAAAGGQLARRSSSNRSSDGVCNNNGNNSFSSNGSSRSSGSGGGCGSGCRGLVVVVVVVVVVIAVVVACSN
jgi:hypothetical protein